MKRFRPSVWKDGKLVREGMEIENPKIDAFLAEIMEVCRKHNLSIGHEDGHGAFEICTGSDQSWIDYANDCTEEA